MSQKEHKIETKLLHSGQTPDPVTLSRGVPVHRTSSYIFRDAKHAEDLFSLKAPGFMYTRIGNPTQEILEKRIADIEGGAASLALSSGTAAIYYSIINICSSGDEIVSTSNLYGGTFTMFDSILPQFGIKVKFVKPNDLAALEKAVSAKTKAVYTETIDNPLLQVADIKKIAGIAHKHKLPLIVDATFTPPYLLRPIEHGADIIIHSLTKWIGGHGTAIGGIVTDSGRFDWSDKKFHLLNQPDKSYHDLTYTKDLGEQNSIAYLVRMRLVALRNLGACISPDNAWIFLQGLETLHLRMERHCENALKTAQFLKSHYKVSWVKYPGLPDDPSYPVASQYLKKGFGGMVVFGVKGGRKAGEKLIDNLKLFSHLANVGDAKSLAIHPASTTHSQLSAEQLHQSDLTEDLIRLSIGIENIDDIKGDLEQALEKV
ncbi:MAG: O-acetylhomoserine aminocarboxypropyltransferase/cysteine synthase [bacterium]|nr:O-acetylhomoserine aminocarboxypropyltransferase/cysteine synthase [bacterium]